MPQKDTFGRIEKAVLRRPGGGKPVAGRAEENDALDQHMALCKALQGLGVTVSLLPADPEFPSGCMVGDLAVVTDSVAILGNFPDKSPRQGEQRSVASILAGHRFLKFVAGPGRLDAADVLRVGDHFYIGLSDHTNREGAAQLAFHLKEFGYEATLLELVHENVLRLGASGADLGRGRILIREEVARHYAFLSHDKIIVPRAEKAAAAALAVNDAIIIPTGCPETRAALDLHGFRVLEIDLSALVRAEGTLSRLVLPIRAAARAGAALGGLRRGINAA